MKYKKYIDRDRWYPFSKENRVYRLAFRTVFASGARMNHIAADINTGATIQHVSDWRPKHCVKRNYKNIYRSYRHWNGDEDENQ
jgi:hypothetical protein